MDTEFQKIFEVSLSAENIRKASCEKEDGEVSDSISKTNKNYPHEPQDELDLHGHTRRDALSEIDKFVRDSICGKKRMVRIITGRGKHSKDGRAVLMPATEQKLFQLKNCGRVTSFRKKEVNGYFDVRLY